METIQVQKKVVEHQTEYHKAPHPLQKMNLESLFDPMVKNFPNIWKDLLC